MKAKGISVKQNKTKKAGDRLVAQSSDDLRNKGQAKDFAKEK